MNSPLVFVVTAIAAGVLVGGSRLGAAVPPQEHPGVAEVLRAEEAFRVAKLKNDTAALDRVLADIAVETNQNGNTRDKAAQFQLWASFPIQSLTIERSDVRITENVAVVTGSQTEQNGTGTDSMLFTRVYLQSAGMWRLVASSQFRNPQQRVTTEQERRPVLIH